jgi:hypothetical protein
MCPLNSKRSRLQELCAGNRRKEEGAETMPRNLQKRGDGRNSKKEESAETEVEVKVCRKPQEVGGCKKFVQETAKERRCHEAFAGNLKREQVAGNVCGDQQER